jgi:hypothetical protein
MIVELSVISVEQCNDPKRKPGAGRAAAPPDLSGKYRPVETNGAHTSLEYCRNAGSLAKTPIGNGHQDEIMQSLSNLDNTLKLTSESKISSPCH